MSGRTFVISALPDAVTKAVALLAAHGSAPIPVQSMDPGVHRFRLVPPPPPGSVRPSRFTPREWELLRHLDTGLTNGQIGKKLGLEEDTIKSHAASLYKKLGVHTRPEAVLVAYRHGWLS